MPVYYLVAMWFSFMTGAFAHHLINNNSSRYVDPVHVTRIGVDYQSGTTLSTCDQPMFVAPEVRP